MPAPAERRSACTTALEHLQGAPKVHLNIVEYLSVESDQLVLVVRQLRESEEFAFIAGVHYGLELL